MNLKHIFILLAVGLISITGFAQKRSLTDMADEAFETKQYTTAVNLYKKAYSKVQGNRQERDRILFQTAECYRYMDSRKEAIKTYDRLVKAKYYSVQPRIFLHLADFKRFEEDWDAAEYNYKEYLKLAPNDGLALKRLQSIDIAKKMMANPTKHQIKNEKSVNTEWSDWSPKFLNNEQKEIIFTSSRPNEEGKGKDAWTGEYFSKIYITQKQKDGSLSEPNLFTEANINLDDANNGELIVTTNGKQKNYYFSRCNVMKNKQINCAIYSKPIVEKGKKGTKKSTPKNQPKGKAESNTSSEDFSKLNLGDTTYNYLHPAVTSDELTLYFSSDRPGGQGDYDVWKATRSSVNEPFGNVTNLGLLVNTEGKEQFPILRTDNHLYYSSDGLPGLGGYDLFHTEFVNGEWTEPINLGYPINSPFDEVGIIYNKGNEEESIAAEESGYFSSNRTGGVGGDDIYSFYRAPLLFSLKGTVRDDRSMQLVEGAKVKLVGDDKSAIETRTNRKGEYEFDNKQIKHNVNYSIYVSKVDYLNVEGKESTVGLTTSKDLVQNFNIKPMPKEAVILPEIRYDLGKWELKDQYQDSLSDLLVILVNNPTYVVELGSHTDSRPFVSLTNDTLSQHRAESVVDFLYARGIEKDRLVAKGYADRVPRTLLSNTEVEFNGKKFVFPKGVTLTNEYISSLRTTEEQEAAHQLNRRSEFRILRTDYIPRDVLDSIEDANLNAPIVDKAGKKPELPTNIPIVYNDNNIKVTSINGNKAQVYIILNGAIVPAIYDERYRDAAALNWDVAMEFLLSGRITKDDFKDKRNAFDEKGNILDNSILTFKSANLGKHSTDKYEVIVKKGMNHKMIINKNGLNDFGSFIFDKANGELIYEK